MRLVLDLSSLRGSAINEGICKEDFSVVYSTFDEAVNMVRELGPNAFLGKLDIKVMLRGIMIWHNDSAS